METAHTAIQVSDLDETTTFYEDVLGLEFQWEFTTDDGIRNYYVGTDGDATLQFKFDPEATVDIDPAGIDHIAFSVENADATFERVVDEADCEVHLEPTTFEAANRRAAFVYDPDGYVVEFVQKI